MSLIIATGSNIGDRFLNLDNAKSKISQTFDFIAESRIYSSPAVDYMDQPDFLNQVLEFKLPEISPEKVMLILLEYEKQLGRVRDIDKGPRLIDMDIIFWGEIKIQQENLKVPHPRWQDRAFVAKPLMELPFYKSLSKKLFVETDFDHEAFPVDRQLRRL
ncbi:MAG: 2-amino-4-hydroxy-6-hydroxymethyldihydropteridine diphosphokinase [Halobacteriovoraceae bacterium]|nr:2-amino-4-hydroxy-6-hydroxymethyldihydropteridine diphosphokinase [Peredibacter sp.]MBJ00827.1 2-amino-4-hydroxy-6-hydroxymethyldihydropteridine diphosphokinase [Halobacteriovoraceae bacterium]|tara:strand:- start:5965 stop:6444 length:480 start_codon:yes stop_codon:yes gene_type:complete